MTHLQELIDVLDEAYPPSLAQSWDSVGLVCGDPADEVSRVLVAVDATEAVVEEAIAQGCQALVVHHPLLLRGVDSVGAHTAKGRLIHRLIRSGCALFTAHTNADAANPGVSDALAQVLGLTVTGPLDAEPSPALDKWVVLVPTVPDLDSPGTDHVSAVSAAMFAAGAGAIGDYRECSWRTEGIGQFRPLPGANPAIGEVGALERVAEARVEVVAPRGARGRVLAALQSAHPYEEPAFDVFELAGWPGQTGIGRVGELPDGMTLRQFTTLVATALPKTAWGVRTAGDPEAPVRTLAVCGGAGDSFLDQVSRLGVDAYVTADLRHHPADEHLRAGGPGLIDVAHWASEFPWTAQAADVLTAKLPVTVRISTLRTDPWTMSAGSANR